MKKGDKFKAFAEKVGAPGVSVLATPMNRTPEEIRAHCVERYGERVVQHVEKMAIIDALDDRKHDRPPRRKIIETVYDIAYREAYDATEQTTEG